MQNEIQKHKLIIIGSGPAGLTAAIYAARANLEPIVLAGIEPGGQLMQTTDVENFPGFPDGILGPELMQKMIAQAERFGAKIIYENVTTVDFSEDRNFKINTDLNEYFTESVIVATGSKAKWLNIENEDKLKGRGVSACATCDGAFYKNKKVAVVGGGDTAMEEALFLTNFASEVILIHRRSEFRASKIMIDRVLANPKIKTMMNSQVFGFNMNPSLKEGGMPERDERLEHKFDKLTDIMIQTNLQSPDGTASYEEASIQVDGLFVAIGHEPQTIIFKGILKLDDLGYIIPSKDNVVKTNISGVFVAGDVSDPKYRQAIVAAGRGCMAMLEVQEYLNER